MLRVWLALVCSAHVSRWCWLGFSCFIMSTFDVEGFLGDPSVEQIDAFKKEDLYAIAAHFGLLQHT